MSEPGSVTRWIDDLRAGERDAAQPLWERYFGRMVRLARQRILAMRSSGAAEDEEDAALSAFDCFCRGAARGRSPRLNGRDDLWRLLVILTERRRSTRPGTSGDTSEAAGRSVARLSGPMAISKVGALQTFLHRSRPLSSPRWWPKLTAGRMSPTISDRPTRSQEGRGAGMRSRDQIPPPLDGGAPRRRGPAARRRPSGRADPAGRHRGRRSEAESHPAERTGVPLRC